MPTPSSEASSPTGIEYVPWQKQAEVHASAARFRVVMAGRQSGKTMTGIAEICHYAMSHPGSILWWVAPNYKVKDRAWRGLLDFIPKSIVAHKTEVELRLTLGNGSVIKVVSADAEDSLVSETLDGVVCDEAGQWKETAWTRGIRPMLGVAYKKDPTRGWALFIGTPRGKNWFHRLWLRGLEKVQDDDGGRWESFHWKSVDSPYSSESDIEDARKTIPAETFIQEYEADPRENALAAFHDFRNCLGVYGQADRFTAIGVDLARKLDFTVMVTMNSKRQVVAIERFQADWSVQKSRIVGQAFALNARVVMDATGLGDVMVQQIREAGVQTEGYLLSNESKQVLVDTLRVAFEQGTITIPNDTQLLAELEAYQIERNDKSGKYHYSAPEGQHDDMVIALALALWGMRGVPIYSSAERTSYMGSTKAKSSYLRRFA